MHKAFCDDEIIELYFRRDESAISATDAEYGALLTDIARNLLGSREDAEECVSDCYHDVWNSIPPERPKRLKSWLCRLVRNTAVDRYRRQHAQKRFAGFTALLDELEECLGSETGIEEELDSKYIGRVISDWLRELGDDDRRLFIRRYFYGDALNALAAESGLPQNRLAQRMYRLRLELKARLEKEDIHL